MNIFSLKINLKCKKSNCEKTVGRGVSGLSYLKQLQTPAHTWASGTGHTSHNVTICQRAQSWWKNATKERKDKIKSRKVITRVTSAL